MKVSLPTSLVTLIKFMSLKPGESFYTDAGEVCMKVSGFFQSPNTVVFHKDGSATLMTTQDELLIQPVDSELTLKDPPGHFKSPYIYHPGVNQPRALVAEEMTLISQRRRIEAIRAYRERLGTSLREGKDACDAYAMTPEMQEATRLRMAESKW